MGGPLLCLGHFAPPPEGLSGCNPPGAPQSVRYTDSCLFLQDKTLKCTVYRIRGSVSASNYIQLPKTSTQSLGLTGRYLYVLFRPLSTKHFIIHLDLSTKVQNSRMGAVHGGFCTPAAPSCLLMAILCPCRTARSSVCPFLTFSRSSSPQLHGFNSPLSVRLGCPGKVTQRWGRNGTWKVQRRQFEGREGGGVGTVRLLHGLWVTIPGWGCIIFATEMEAGQEQKALWAG